MRSKTFRGALFRSVNKAGRLGPGRLTGHSIRNVIIRWGKAAGVSLVEMQLAGRWRSPVMPGRYAQG